MVKVDVFFPLCPMDLGGKPSSELSVIYNFLELVQVADELGYKCAWISTTRFSLVGNHSNPNSALPHWKGEVGLCTDFFQIANAVINCTERIDVGSAAVSVFTQGGAFALADAVGTFCMMLEVQQMKASRILAIKDALERYEAGGVSYDLNVSTVIPTLLEDSSITSDTESPVCGLFPNGRRSPRAPVTPQRHHSQTPRRRKLRLGFTVGRFDYMLAPFGVRPRNAIERRFWPRIKKLMFYQNISVFLLLLQGRTISSSDIEYKPKFTKADFTSDEWSWLIRNTEIHNETLADKADNENRYRISEDQDQVLIPSFLRFDYLSSLPREWNRDYVKLYLASGDRAALDLANKLAPVRCLGLPASKEENEDMNDFMSRIWYNERIGQGSKWKRGNLCQVVIIFLDGDPAKTPSEQSISAKSIRTEALGYHSQCIHGANALSIEVMDTIAGNPAEVAEELVMKHDQNSRLMIWANFMNCDDQWTHRALVGFREEVVPMLEARGWCVQMNKNRYRTLRTERVESQATDGRGMAGGTHTESSATRSLTWM